MEQKVRSAAKSPQIYILALFDCCRIKYEKEMEKLTRSGGQEKIDESKKDENLILIFGCSPNWTVPSKSTLVTDFFDFLSNGADRRGYVILPGNLYYFKT